jgi:hypothetical protein
MCLTGVHKRGAGSEPPDGTAAVAATRGRGNSRTVEGQPWREGATFQFGVECHLDLQAVRYVGGRSFRPRNT